MCDTAVQGDGRDGAILKPVASPLPPRSEVGKAGFAEASQGEAALLIWPLCWPQPLPEACVEAALSLVVALCNL